jgi:hypothetical protein
MKLAPRKRLHLGKQTMRTLIEDDLAKAYGGTRSSDCRTGASEANNTCDTCVCPTTVFQ